MQTQKPEIKKPNGAAPAQTPPAASTAIAPTHAASPAPAPAAAAATLEVTNNGQIVRVGFDTLEGFKALQRIGTAFAQSSLVPDAYKGQLANCIIAIEMAARMGASPLMVMQNLYLVHGRPSWSSQFLIASFNNCGRFTAIKYRWAGERGKPSWSCTAWAREKETGDIVEGPEVSMAMAKSEGWIDKKGSKWLTIPQLMLAYRAATFLVRTTAPELTMGLRTADEQEDMGADPSAFDAPTPGGVEGLKALVAAKNSTVPPVETAQEPPHDPATGEGREPGTADGEPPEHTETDPTLPEID